MAIDQPVNRPLYKKTFQTQLKLINSSAARRRVRFNERHNQIHNIHDSIAEEDSYNTWYTKKEYREFRNSVQDAVYELKKRSLRRSQNHDMSFAHIVRALYNLAASVDYIVDDPWTLVNDQIHHMLMVQYSQDERFLDFIGVEKYVDTRLRRECKERVESIYDVVQDIQKEHEAGFLSDKQLHDELRDSCLNFSQASSLFAQFQAKARFLASFTSC
ncbi:hypothetical protein ACA910_012271 [Epithemia clementina (nom. ined.)]